MALLKLKCACKDYLWGGHRLKDEYHKESDSDIVAETWELSCHPDGPSVIENGPYKGRTLSEFISKEGKEVLGINCRRFRDFPILTKFIDARDNLSIQVHPDNRYALTNEGQYGKTEMWYVLDAGENAFLYYGFRKEISRQEFAKRIKEDTLLEVLNAVPVRKGDVLFIESGTIHAIGKDILIAEIQQNSNVTYRVYDYGRVGKDGKQRDLQIEKALDVTRRVPILRSDSAYPHVADCDYFTVDKLYLDGAVMRSLKGSISDASFVSLLFIEGEGRISSGGEELDFCKGDSFFLSAGSGEYEIEGSCEVLVTSIREKAAPVRIGILAGSAETRIGLVDIHHSLITSRVIPTDSSLPAEEMLKKAAGTALELLEEQHISLEQCVGVGVGIPGTVDWKSGWLLYSNNLKWKEVDVAGVIGKVLPLPVRIANDADCAALGEHVAGAGKGHNNLVMMTLGNGVGGGILIGGKIFEGSGLGGSELGHMTVMHGGKKCSCGRAGCLEAYVSVPALLEAATDFARKPLTLSDIMKGCSLEAQDLSCHELQPVLDQYTDMLAEGIVNVVNLFRPELILLGGQMSEYADVFLEPLRKRIREDAFGGDSGTLPDIAVATLGRDAGIIGASSLV